MAVWLLVLAAVGLAAWLPATALPEGYHAFADDRTLGWVPHALNVWSNVPFALVGLWGLWQVERAWAQRRQRGGAGRGAVQRLGVLALLALTALGLVLTAVCSGAYHWHPHDAGLCVDRLGMSAAFAGVLGLAVADRVRLRAGLGLAAMVLVAAPWAAWWAWHGANMTPWAVLQGAGLLLLVALGVPRGPAQLGVAWWAVVLAYAVGKALEVGDHAVWALSGQWVSGHSLKHVVAALAVVPVLVAVERQLRRGPSPMTPSRPSAPIPRGQNLPTTCGDALEPRSADMPTSAACVALAGTSMCTAAAALGAVPPAPHASLSSTMDPMTPSDPTPSSAMPAPAPAPAPHAGQFALLGQRRFAPFFWTQFAGAANDNLFKFAFTVMVTYMVSVSWLPPDMAGLVIGALFILPYLIFSATSGQLADKLEKRTLIRALKLWEIAIMALAAWGFWAGHVPVLLACIFLMGLQSAVFGPVKFAYLPQHLSNRELTGGNGMVEMGTFVAILVGQLVGGVLVVVPGVGPMWVAVACLALAVVGAVMAFLIPLSPATDPQLKINLNPVTETLRNIRLAGEMPSVFRSLLGISWMWFFGAVFLSQFPAFAKEVLHGDAHVASFLLAVFSVGIGAGSLLCEKLSGHQVEIGLVPVGAIGMTVFAIDLFFATRGLPPAPAAGLHDVGGFLAVGAHWRVMLDLGLMSLFTGLFSVPMYALIQLRSRPSHRARIIAANNILNALFMIASAVIAGALLQAGFSISQIFLFTGIANAVVAAYIFFLVPEYWLRFHAWVLTHLVYRFQARGTEHIPAEGPAVLIANHVSFVDAVLLMAASPRPIRFIMDHKIFKVPVLGWLFKLAKAIPIAPQRDDPQAYEAAFAEAAKVLREGELLGIFPEGRLTRDGHMGEFKNGVLKILEQARADGLSVPVVPMALTNLWGSFFSRIEPKGAMTRPFRRGLCNRVGLNVGAPLPPDAHLRDMQTAVTRLLQD